MKRGLLAALLVLPCLAKARVFSYKDNETGAYVRGTGGLLSLDQDPFGNSSGPGTTISQSTKYDYGGELGFMLGLTPNLHLRLAAEVIQANPVAGDGTDASGATLFTLNSSVFVFNPNVAFEYVYSTHGNMRFYGELGVGYANVTVVNTYKMTSAGTAALGVSDFNETMETNVLSGEAGIGLETLFTDNVTFLADFGYRYLPVHSLKYKADVNNIVSPGGVHKGDVVLNQDGSKRQFNLGGVFTGVAFRFYLNFL